LDEGQARQTSAVRFDYTAATVADIGAVIPLTWELEQFNRLSQQHPELAARALRRLIAEDAELRWALVVSAYREGIVSLGKAAELLDMHLLELRQQFIELGIPLYIGPTDVEEARAEINAVRNWRSSNRSQTPANQ